MIFGIEMSDNYQLDFDKAQTTTRNIGPVPCLGMTFETDEERRRYFTEKLREKLQDPEFRKIEGFPLGSDEGGRRMRCSLKR